MAKSISAVAKFAAQEWNVEQQHNVSPPAGSASSGLLQNFHIHLQGTVFGHGVPNKEVLFPRVRSQSFHLLKLSCKINKKIMLLTILTGRRDTHPSPYWAGSRYTFYYGWATTEGTAVQLLSRSFKLTITLYPLFSSIPFSGWKVRQTLSARRHNIFFFHGIWGYFWEGTSIQRQRMQREVWRQLGTSSIYI